MNRVGPVSVAPFVTENAIVPLLFLLQVSTQAILGSRIYALYGSRPFQRSIFVVFWIISVLAVPPAVVAFELYVPGGLLIVYNTVGLLTDLTFFVFIFAHAIRTRPPSRHLLHPPRRIHSSSLGNFVVSGANLLSLMVADSVKYYLSMVVAYVVSYATLDERARICYASKFCEVGLPIGFEDALGIVTMVAVFSSLLAPRMLLNVRKEYYTSIEFGASAQNAEKEITWKPASRRLEGAETFSLSTFLVSQDLTEETQDIPMTSLA
ncbi:hypothetical protein SCHPADRAFT_721526 [Schizopora paradoxa]|uniref:Uncharacterized protein n=1 Tax=Schizopora paradoxa TaxID=27342 RepID=A0A0H2R1E4_9AGAM|nr:hypothetical protein SCHPADRAFT_721526 [Schizopora paradoxa]